MNTAKHIRIHYFTDVLCVWAYLAQIRLDELIKKYSENIEISYHFISIFGCTSKRIGDGWKDKGSYTGFSKHTQNVCRTYPHIELHKDIWAKNTPKTSATSHLVIKAVQCLIDDGTIQNKIITGNGERSVFEEFIWQIRLAFFKDLKDISKMSVLMEIAKSMNLPVTKIQDMLDDGSALAELFRDVELQEEYGVEGSPTYILNNGRQKLYGNVGYRIIEANIHEILYQPELEASWC